MKIRPGTCSSCGASYRMPADFPATKARCRACGGVVEVSAEAIEVEASAPAASAPAEASFLPSAPLGPNITAAVPASSIAGADPAPTALPPVPPAAAKPLPVFSPRPRSRKPEAEPRAKRGLFGFGAPKEARPAREKAAPAKSVSEPLVESVANEQAAPHAADGAAPKHAAPKIVAKPEVKPPAKPVEKPVERAKHGKHVKHVEPPKQVKPVEPAMLEPARPSEARKSLDARVEPAKPTPKPSGKPPEPKAPPKRSALTASRPLEDDEASMLETVIAPKREETAKPQKEVKLGSDAKEPATASGESKQGGSSALEKIMARKRALAEAPSPSQEPKRLDAESKHHGGSTLEKILARKRAEASEPEEIPEVEPVPARKAVVKSHAPAANSAATAKPLSKASAHPASRKGSAQAANGHRKHRGHEDDEHEAREERRHAHAPKKPNALMICTVVICIVAIGAVFALLASGDDAPQTTAPIVAAVKEPEKPVEAAPVDPASVPAEGAANEKGDAREAAAKVDAAKDPEKPAPKQRFQAAVRDALAPLDAPKTDEAVQGLVDKLSAGTLGLVDRREAPAILALTPRAAFGAVHAKLVGIAREGFTPQVTVEARTEVERHVDTFFRLSATLTALSGYHFTDAEEQKFGPMKTAVAGYDAETEAVKILDELIRAQNSCLMHLARWSELWKEKKLATAAGWNAFVGDSGGGMRDDS